MSSPMGAGAEFRPETHFDIFWDHRAVLADRKVRFFLPNVMLKIDIFATGITDIFLAISTKPSSSIT